MLGAVAALAMAVGLIGAAEPFAQDHELTAAQTAQPVVEVLAVQSVDTPAE